MKNSSFFPNIKCSISGLYKNGAGPTWNTDRDSKYGSELIGGTNAEKRAKQSHQASCNKWNEWICVASHGLTCHGIKTGANEWKLKILISG